VEVIPPQDYQFLYDRGVTSIFGPGKHHIFEYSFGTCVPLQTVIFVL